MRIGLIGVLSLVMGCAAEGDPPKDDTSTDDTSVPSLDADGDGYAAAEDCDDRDAAVHPGADDAWYDGIDADCDGADDYDADADGVRGGDAGADCLDADATIYPGADERCDALDNDCDAEIDEGAVDAIEVYADADQDGFGAGAPQGAYCEAPAGTAAIDGDCDDAVATVSPGADEVCDGIDNDCSGFLDDDPVDGTTWYADFDADGYGDPGAGARTCVQPAGYLLDATDCDGGDPLSYPGAIEYCDTKDNNCEGTIDEGALDERTYYADADLDGYGDAASTATGCGAPSGYVEPPTDCDDADGARSPGAVETCDGVDNDCDGEIDGDSPDATAYHPDLDGDGYGSSSASVSSCDPVSGWIADGSDCDDADAGENPLAVESCDGDDDDCDGSADESDAVDADTWYIDADSDGYGSPAVTVAACARPRGYAATADDCDDGSAASSPAGREACDAVDNDCDAEIDEDSAYDAPDWYADTDVDGYGDAGSSSAACAAPAGFVGDATDCDDTDPSISPAAVEARDLVDEDCDGYVDEDYIAPGDIVVTEIARQPYTGGTGLSAHAQAQWFEVLNTTVNDIDLSSWYLAEEDGDSFSVPPAAGLVVPAGGYAVLCYDDQWFATPANCDFTWGESAWGGHFYDTTFYFDRDQDLLSLTLDGLLIDEVAWSLGADTSGDEWPRVARYSMELDPASTDATLNDDAGAWCLASSSNVYSLATATGHPDYGTPGAANGDCP